MVTAGGSYLSAHDPRLLLGLGRATEPEWIDIQWPGTKPRRLPKLIGGRYHRIER